MQSDKPGKAPGRCLVIRSVDRPVSDEQVYFDMEKCEMNEEGHLECPPVEEGVTFYEDPDEVPGVAASIEAEKVERTDGSDPVIV